MTNPQYKLPVQIIADLLESKPDNKKHFTVWRPTPKQEQLFESILQNFQWMKSTSSKNRPVDLPYSLNFYRDFESLNVPSKFIFSGAFGMGFGLYVGSVSHILWQGPTTKINAQHSIRKQFTEGFFRLPPRINQQSFWRSIFGRVGLAFCLGDTLATSYRNKVDVWNAIFGCLTGGVAYGLARYPLPKAASSASMFFGLTSFSFFSLNLFFDHQREEGWWKRLTATVNSSVRTHYEAGEKLKEITKKQFDAELKRVTQVQEMRALRQEWEDKEWSRKLAYWKQQQEAATHHPN
eukprot:CAMPEP_0168578674 /NCGR_PEP_ID=MMETSP0413-20121227/21461_1 /TAXON_ID=136452 /ORGANISM="Filamoeba nolandi, Strain NC-AS-23-1" /LENGTH=292 /DNA_ID=CAMNT_0008612541 /DNA_START=7 /DNA_END=882 /DNA_ORIENTATION=+